MVDKNASEVTVSSARAFWVESAGRGAIRSEPLELPDAASLLVETAYSGVSRGTEALVWHGKVPPTEFDRMRAPFQGGQFPFPVKYGYSSVGRVRHGPSAMLGRSVFCLYPHQTAYVVPVDAVVVLPEGVPEARAILAANLETALNAVWDAAPLVGDRISIVGGGVVGCLCAYLASRICAVEVELVDRLEARRSVADALGTAFALPDNARRDRDIVFHASGTPAGLGTALELVRAEGTVFELSWYGTDRVELGLGERFHSERLTLRASQVGEVSRNARSRYTRRARLELAIAQCNDSALDVLIDSEGSFDELPTVMPALTAPGSGTLCHRVVYR